MGANITLNANSLTLGSAAQVLNGSASNYITTNGTGAVNVQNLNAARGPVTLHIGTALNYNPITIANTGASDTFSAKVSEGISNAPGGAVNATWDISEGTSGGSNVSLTLGWNQSQESTTFSRNTAQVGHLINGVWTPESSGVVSGSNPYVLQATGITSFSPFGVMNLSTLATSESTARNEAVYPNPFREAITVVAENGGIFYLYDQSGKLVAAERLIKGRNLIEKQYLPAGVYLYQLHSDSGEQTSSGRLIKH